MKNIHVLSLILFIGSMAHAMEQQLALPDWKGMRKQLIGDYSKHLRNRLEEYKKTDISIVPWEMNTLVNDGKTITKLDATELKRAIRSVRDSQYNCFLHIAVDKDDEKTVRWLCSARRSFDLFKGNSSGETPLGLCIKKLLPGTVDNVATQNIFTVLLNFATQWVLGGGVKISCLKSIIALQLAHAQNGSTFVIDQNMLQKLLPNYQQQSLSNYYKNAQDEDGQTFAHAFSDNPDKLFELVEKDYVSFAKDKQGRTALDYTVAHLQSFYNEKPPVSSCLGYTNHTMP